MRRNLVAASLVLLALAPIASAQPVYNPITASPFARPALSPYLNLVPGTAPNLYYMGVGREFDIRNQLLRPIVVAPELGLGNDPYRSPSYSAVTGYQNAEDWVNQRIRETQLSPTGHPAGFLMPSPYYRLPNRGSFIPYHQIASQQQQLR